MPYQVIAWMLTLPLVCSSCSTDYTGAGSATEAWRQIQKNKLKEAKEQREASLREERRPAWAKLHTPMSPEDEAAFHNPQRPSVALSREVVLYADQITYSPGSKQIGDAQGHILIRISSESWFLSLHEIMGTSAHFDLTEGKAKVSGWYNSYGATRNMHSVASSPKCSIVVDLAEGKTLQYGPHETLLKPKID